MSTDTPITSAARRPVLTDGRPLWMKRAWWLSTYLGTAGVCALRRDWPLWPRKGQQRGAADNPPEEHGQSVKASVSELASVADALMKGRRPDV